MCAVTVLSGLTVETALEVPHVGGLPPDSESTQIKDKENEKPKNKDRNNKKETATSKKERTVDRGTL